MVDRRDRRWGSPSGGPRFPRTLRVNHLLQQVVAEEIERLGDDDPRLALVTVTGVKVDPDLRHATVWLSTLSEAARDALGEDRVRLQAAIGRQVRMKRTPQLTFAADPGVAQGARVEDILQSLPRRDDGGEEHDQP
jgi:ribosome-binding factor A